MNSIKDSVSIHNEFFDVENNALVVTRSLRYYFKRDIEHPLSCNDTPDFFITRPQVIEKLLQYGNTSHLSLCSAIEECVIKSKKRHGYVGVQKWRNIKLDYFWYEFTPFPFVLGDSVTDLNIDGMYYLLNHFINFSIENPVIYGDVTSGQDIDPDLKIMLREITKHSSDISEKLDKFQLEQLVTFQKVWPISQVNNLCLSLKTADIPWIDLIIEHLIYVLWIKHKNFTHLHQTESEMRRGIGSL